MIKQKKIFEIKHDICIVVENIHHTHKAMYGVSDVINSFALKINVSIQAIFQKTFLKQIYKIVASIFPLKITLSTIV